MKKINRALAMIMAALMLFGTLPFALGEGILQKGDAGDEVLRIQERLKELEYLDGDPTGVFDEETEKALMEFQRLNGLLESGLGDERTLTVLFSEAAIANNPASSWDWLTEGEAETGAAWFGAPMATGMPVRSNAAAYEDISWNTDEYSYYADNGFQSVAANPLSTFAADVDTASYAQVRRMILAGTPVPAGAVRVEEMLNYFHYDYPQPTGNSPLGVSMELAACPWNEETLLLQIGLQGVQVTPENRPRHNLVFLIDVSGSMFGEDRLDLVKRAFLLMLEELEPTDTVSLVTYASSDQVLLSGVSAGEKTRIMEAISSLEAAGSTNSAAGITTAYRLAEENAQPGDVSRILMATDGDFNVGVTSESELARLVMDKKENGVTLTMLGVGYGNYKDNKLETLADLGNGNYYYLDTIFEARRALVTEGGGTFVAIANDVKLQLDFNPAYVGAYRLIGYEDRVMAAEDFADDTKDGGEIGSGHRVTALYEIVPAGSAFLDNLPQSKYAAVSAPQDADQGEWLTLNIRYKLPGETASVLETYPLTGEISSALSDNMAFAAAVAETAMLLRDSEYKGSASYASALDLARSCKSVTGDAYKEEFVYLLTLLERR